jgi:hypothetical protein
MRKPEKSEKYPGEYIVSLDDYSNGFMFSDIKTAQDFWQKWKSSGISEEEWIEDNA